MPSRSTHRAKTHRRSSDETTAQRRARELGDWLDRERQLKRGREPEESLVWSELMTMPRWARSWLSAEQALAAVELARRDRPGLTVRTESERGQVVRVWVSL